MATRLSRVIANSVPFPASRKWDAAFWQDIAQMYSQRALGRQKGVSQARYSRDVFPSNVFHRFSRLKSYITSLSCQKRAVRACISAISCHEEAFLPSGAPSGMHDSHFLPLLDARPFHAGHPEGHLAGDPRQEREGTWRGIHAESEIIPTGSSPGEIKGDSDWRTTLFSWRHPPFG